MASRMLKARILRRHAFFEQTVFQRQLGDDLLQCAGLTPEVLHFVRRRGPGGVARQALLPASRKSFDQR